MTDSNDDIEKHSSGFATDRRDFLKIAAGTIAAQQLFGACAPSDEIKLPRVSEEQKRFKKKGKSPVRLAECASYQELDAKKLATLLGGFELPDIKNKSVLLKINMVDYRSDRPLTTDPAVIAATIALIAEKGAKQITVGDASALNRDTEFLLEATGIGACCKKSAVPFVDLNIDDIEKVDNQVGLTREKYFALPHTVVNSDVVVSMPKLKTHRWALVTASLKNLFGAIPGRAYGWPKNFLHVNGIDPSVIDIAVVVKPSFAIIDAIVSMEGHGPLDGIPVKTGFLAFGPDLAAVDAVCCKAMHIDPFDVPYLRLAEEVLGNTQMSNIDLTGTKLESLAHEFALPTTYKRGPSGHIVRNFEDSSSQAGAT